MSAAGAPPPPPPPPSHINFDDLPAELFLDIIQYLHVSDYVSFALAIYPILQRHGLAPPLTEDIYRRIMDQRLDEPPDVEAFLRLPIELMEEIMTYLQPTDRIAMLFAHRSLFLRYLPDFSNETKIRIWKSRDTIKGWYTW
ncbi:hypothetical protein P154DRAFT_520383 [Amniculicola lignicola CBS 123094]|uniref:F-box domain-containing protein n=1 Tax=Amniculicola lignicola CBS 123094 TaxID=1392246 RepID=A0A6A5WQH7_9PLEO|nr:hypothetical protein P154DRAFT_520383 [Amniculicola lignicola CBS 123094]